MGQKQSTALAFPHENVYQCSYCKQIDCSQTEEFPESINLLKYINQGDFLGSCIQYKLKNAGYDTSIKFENYNKNISLKENNVYTFVKNIMSNVFCKDKFEAISDKIALKIKATEFLQGVSIEKYINCDTFKVIDKFILRWITDRLIEENISATINKDTLKAIVDKRTNESNHYNRTYNSEYRLLSNALKLIEGMKTNSSLPDDIFKYYVADGCLADTWYRHFYFYFDKLENIEPYSDLRVLIENVYTNEYLEKSNAKCINYLTNNSNNSFNKQKDFYNNYLIKYIF